MLNYLQAGHRSYAACRGLVRIAFAAVLALAFCALAQSSPTKLVDRPAADFALRSLEGENLRLSEHLGEVVVVNFWATWCGPCRQEMPVLDELYNKYRRAGLVMFGVNIDDDGARAVEMGRTMKVTYPLLFDTRKEVSRAYQVGSMPVTILIDRAGVVRYVAEGYKPGYEKTYAEQLRKLLNE